MSNYKVKDDYIIDCVNLKNALTLEKAEREIDTGIIGTLRRDNAEYQAKYDERVTVFSLGMEFALGAGILAGWWIKVLSTWLQG